MSCSTTTTEWSPASDTSSSAVRSVSCGVIPATGSSTSRSSGSCISSMPISSHCFWPCDSTFACVSRSEVSPVLSSTLSIRSRCAGVRRATSAFQNDLSPFKASSRLSKTVRNSNTLGFWNLRPMPACAISGSVSASRSIARPNQAVPLSGLVLPVMTSIIVVFPAPFGPITHSSSPGST